MDDDGSSCPGIVPDRFGVGVRDFGASMAWHGKRIGVEPGTPKNLSIIPADINVTRRGVCRIEPFAGAAPPRCRASARLIREEAGTRPH